MKSISILALLSTAAVSLAVPVAPNGANANAIAARSPIGIVGEAQFIDVDGNADFGKRAEKRAGSRKPTFVVPPSFCY